MPSPFPGMDPFIESQVWEDFHYRLMVVMSDPLTERLRPRYLVKVEERVYVEHWLDGQTEVIRPELTILERRGGAPFGTGQMTAVMEPVLVTVPIPEAKRELFLTVRLRDSLEVVTVIEVLSPTNKRAGSDGRREYLTKRETVLRSLVHLVELDLLRAGERLPTIEPPPPADYYAFVGRRQDRPRMRVYPWTLRHRLPTLPIPLADGDPDVPLDLQAVFTTVYDRAGYDYGLDYRRPVEPPLAEADSAWAQALLQPPPV